MDAKSSAVVGLWALCVGAGIVEMVRYEVTPGLKAAPPPSQELDMGSKNRLYVFLHPQCECSLATVDELGLALNQTKGKYAAIFYFYKPAGESDSWCKNSSLWSESQNIPNCSLQVDRDARMAKKFGARCSGQVLIYSGKTGKLVFSGGVTPGRGHGGECRGADEVVAYGRTGVSLISHTSVFGCALW